jgi:hypothetical protein
VTEFEKCLNRFAGLKFYGLSLEVSILCVSAPLPALRETKKLRVFALSCLRVSCLSVKKMLQAFHLRVSIPLAFFAPLRVKQTVFSLLLLFKNFKPCQK